MIRGFSAHLNSLYGDLDEADRCVAAVQDGFQCVEMWTPPGPEPAALLIDSLQKFNLSVATVNTHQGPEADDFGVVSDPSLSGWWREHFIGTVEFARAAHAEAINVLVGGRRPTATKPAQQRCLLDNLEWALSRLDEGDPALLLEPLNGADRRSPLLQNTGDVLSVMQQLGSPPGLRMLFDAYHLFQEEADLIEALHRAAGKIGHVQLADYPGRAEPGTGEVPVDRFLKELARSGYAGWIGLEYSPSQGGSPFAWLLEYAEFDDRLIPGVAS
ncbi:MAG TPA: TIM barrel protein [Candidatus Solibacter sp.]|jgi:hydroxypyruvate isomerase|nr:TIM barrel protein [Candidatus Solibacter sp.]